MNFHDEQNRQSYATRNSDQSWISLIRDTVDISNKVIADIGCGGGIYTKSLINMGASQITGVDFSEEMLIAARSNCNDIQNVTFIKGNAYETNLPVKTFDIVLERALIHHLNDLDACFKEAHRIIKDDGIFIVQDRTPNDCLLAGDEHHIRGYFFERFPQLIDTEISRRYDEEQVQQALERNGFRLTKIVSLWETRRMYNHYDQLEMDLLRRTGRSILHELTDDELQQLVSFIREKLEINQPPIIEKDCWTVWFASKA